MLKYLSVCVPVNISTFDSILRKTSVAFTSTCVHLYTLRRPLKWGCVWWLLVLAYCLSSLTYLEAWEKIKQHWLSVCLHHSLHFNALHSWLYKYCHYITCITIILHSTYGWDHVVQGLVQLGFILMDTYGPKAVFGRVEAVPNIQSGPIHQCCKLGTKILLKTFKVR